MTKENIKKYVGAGLLSIAILAGAGLCIEAIDLNIEHTEEWCPLNSILGVEHQMRKIENSYKFNSYYDESGDMYYCDFDVIFAKDGIVEYYTDATRISDENGNIIGYAAKEGYLSGTKAVKRVQYAEEDAIIINKSAPERKIIYVPKIVEGELRFYPEEVPVSLAEEMFEYGYINHPGKYVAPYSGQIVIKKTK